MANKDNRGHNAVPGKQGFQPISIPAEAPEAVSIETPNNPYITSTDNNFTAAEQAWFKTKPAEEGNTFPDETIHRLQKIDNLGLQAANKLMFLREQEVEAKSSFSLEGQQKAEVLSKKSYEIHAAILRAREEIKHAKAFIEGDYISPALPGATSVIDADNLSYEAEELASMIEEKTENDLTPEEKYRLAQANAHILNARKTIKQALEN